MQGSTGASAPSSAGVIHFAGLKITPMTVDQTVAALDGRDPAAPFTTFVTPNVEHAYFRKKNPEFDKLSEECWISTNDSRVLRAAARLAGLELEFAPGAYVVDRMFKEIVRPDDRLTVIGGQTALIDAMRAQFGLTQVAHHNPPMGFIHQPDAVQACIEFVAANPARFVFVAMGPPHSEQLCQRIIDDGRSTGVALCIGSSFTVLTGQSDPAPDWMENAGMVWLYRLAKEPKRLWKRYLVRDMYGLMLCLRDVVAIRLGLKRAHAKA